MDLADTIRRQEIGGEKRTPELPVARRNLDSMRVDTRKRATRLRRPIRPFRDVVHYFTDRVPTYWVGGYVFRLWTHGTRLVASFEAVPL